MSSTGIQFDEVTMGENEIPDEYLPPLCPTCVNGYASCAGSQQCTFKFMSALEFDIANRVTVCPDYRDLRNQCSRLS